jgi:hypothetical protein
MSRILASQQPAARAGAAGARRPAASSRDGMQESFERREMCLRRMVESLRWFVLTASKMAAAVSLADVFSHSLCHRFYEFTEYSSFWNIFPYYFFSNESQCGLTENTCKNLLRQRLPAS